MRRISTINTYYASTELQAFSQYNLLFDQGVVADQSSAFGGYAFASNLLVGFPKAYYTAVPPGDSNWAMTDAVIDSWMAFDLGADKAISGFVLVGRYENEAQSANYNVFVIDSGGTAKPCPGNPYNPSTASPVFLVETCQEIG